MSPPSPTPPRTRMAAPQSTHELGKQTLGNANSWPPRPVICGAALTACGPSPGSNWGKLPRAAPSLSSATGGGTKRHSAYRFGSAVIAYPWHPLHGQKLSVVRRRGTRGTEVIDVEVQPGVSRELPAWMTDEAACAGMSLGPAQVSVAALNELRTVLSQHSTPSSRLESSDGERNKKSDETITQGGQRPVHAGPAPRAKPTSGRSQKGGTAESAGGSDAGSARGRIRREPKRRGGKR